MTVLCGFDFSASSMRAAEVAADFAARLKVPLHLVHVLPPWPGQVLTDEKTSLLAATRRALEVEAEKLRRKGIELKLHVEPEHSTEALVQAAERLGAKLLVVGATGREEAHGGRLGSTADRLAQQARIPTVVVRRAEPFQQWVRGERPLRVLVGIDPTAISKFAWDWARELGRIGPVELIGAHLYWPPQEFHRLGLTGPRSFIDADPEVEKTLRAELGSMCEGGPNVTSRLRLLPSMGRPADRLVLVAHEEAADLIVVGSHSRSAIAGLWEGSVSRGVLRESNEAVACVPAPIGSAKPRVTDVRTVIAATDFSPTGDAAIAHAYGQVPLGGKVYLVHVIPPTGARPATEGRDILEASEGLEKVRAAALEKLRSLIPLEARGKFSEPIILESREPAAAIAQSAERLGAEVICLGTHGRQGLSKAVLGSVAQGVLSQTRRPVLLVREPKV
jgi:nucleotide-binding universal stress UspA family protein